MKIGLCLAASLLMLTAACTSSDVDRSIAATAGGIAAQACERSPSCTLRDASPRYGSPQQRVVEDELSGRQKPL